MPHTIAVLVQYKAEVIALCERLLRRAGYQPTDTVTPKGGEFQEEFDGLLRTLSYIGARKVDDYGDFRMQDIRSFPREVWGAYWDIQRKFGRLENQLQLFNSSLNDPPNMDDVMETLGDQAVYCVRMIQIFRRLEEKGLVPK